jgi:hypothetical protein
MPGGASGLRLQMNLMNQKKHRVNRNYTSGVGIGKILQNCSVIHAPAGPREFDSYADFFYFRFAPSWPPPAIGSAHIFIMTRRRLDERLRQRLNV